MNLKYSSLALSSANSSTFDSVVNAFLGTEVCVKFVGSCVAFLLCLVVASISE
jgi:hypothetical protein